ncbi:hypothetical protein APSETT445_008100 [Aspergillus pseudonomiae]
MLDLEGFVSRKVKELKKYDEALEKIEENKALMDSGKMMKEEFIAKALMELWYSLSSAAYDEMTNDE